VKGKQTTS